jgi:hypothetical protein
VTFQKTNKFIILLYMKKANKNTSTSHRPSGNNVARANRFALSSSRIEGIKPSPALKRKFNTTAKKWKRS